MLRILILAGLPLSFLNLACTEAIPEFNRLVPLTSIQFEGKDNQLIKLTSLQSPLQVTAECDPGTTDIMVSTNNGNQWNKGSALFGSRMGLNCKANKSLSLSLLTDGSGILNFTPGTPSTHKVLLMAQSGKDYSSHSILTIQYLPDNKIKPGSLIMSSSGKVKGTNLHLSYRINPTTASRTEGSTYKVKSSQ